MNYRHAFHAGNFADVVKHALFARLIAYLGRKDKPFRVMDTHGGRGVYDLTSDEARRTGEAAENHHLPERGIQVVRCNGQEDEEFQARDEIPEQRCKKSHGALP